MAGPTFAGDHAETEAAEKVSPTDIRDAFRCIGASCEDTCCQGWAVPVDKKSYGKYQSVSDEELQPKLRQLVTVINGGSDSAYGTIQLSDGRCPFLSEGLCGIQKRLGEEYLCHTCATYPRVQNNFGDRPETTLDLSCPEAARLTLLETRSMDFGESFLSGGSANAVRKLVLNLLQDRSHSIAKRLMLVGDVCDRWSEFEFSQTSEEKRLLFINGFPLAVKSRSYVSRLQQGSGNPATQLAIALDLMVARMKLDYTQPRHVALYREFVDGLQLKAGATPESFGARYSAAYNDYYAPFMERNQHMLERYLVSYALKTMFPFGLPPVNKALKLQQGEETAVAQYMLMSAYFSISKAVMIGLAAKYQSEFAAEHVVRCIQSISKMLEHCETYPARLLEILAGRGIKDSRGMAVLTDNS